MTKRSGFRHSPEAAASLIQHRLQDGKLFTQSCYYIFLAHALIIGDTTRPCIKVGILFMDGSYVQPDDPLVPEFAEGALLEFERLQAEAPGIMQVMAEGAYKGAQQLNLDDYHGIMEVLQNADDLHATDVAVSLLETSGHKELLILHNGEPVSVHHVLAMTYAFISTKTEDPQQKGKFGVGLKTLGRIANRMEVHSNTYSFAIANQRISKAEPCPPILGFYQPGTRSTLLRLSLLDAFDVDEFLD